MHAATLRKYALPTLLQFFLDGNGILQEDNAPPHRSRVADAAQDGIRVLLWPAQSPDLNPIKTIWNLVKRILKRREPRPSSLQVLERYVEEACADIPLEEYRALIESMPDRIQAIIDNRGEPTKF